LATLLLATVKGQLLSFDTETMEQKVLFRTREDDGLMGICRHGEMLFVAGQSRLFRLRMDDFALVGKTRKYIPSLGLHQMSFYDERLYTTATKRNQIWIFDKNLKRKGKIRITPPIAHKRSRYKKNYNHINSIVKHEGAFYINLNWLTDQQYADSGVLKTDEDFNETDRFRFAWESHDFQFVDGKMMAICSTSGRDKKIHHPNRSGLMVNGELVWEHDAEESFCKALCSDQRYIYICGGTKAVRKKRKDTGGIIYQIDKAGYKLERKISGEGLPGIRGALLRVQDPA